MANLYNIVGEQFPEFVRAEYPVFVEFVKAYYAWLGAQTGKLEDITNLSKTPAQFVQYFKEQLDFDGLYDPVVPFNPRYIETIKQIYQAKGSTRALEHILKVSYGVESSISFPGESVLRASDARWEQESFIVIQKVFGATIPQTINDFHIVSGAFSQRVAVTRFTVIDSDTIYLYFKKLFDLVIPIGQKIEIRNENHEVIMTGDVVGSPAQITIVDGGDDWQVGQIVVLPGTVKDTIARVTSITPGDNGSTSLGAIRTLEILEYGYEHNDGQTALVSPYRNKPIGGLYDLDITIVSENPPVYQYDLSIVDGLSGSGDHAQGYFIGITDDGYFAEDYVDITYAGVPKFDNEIDPFTPTTPPSTGLTLERWLASRALLRLRYDSLVTLKGEWKTSEGLISNQNIRLQDNSFYQQYSYVLETTISPSKYGPAFNALHPVGMKAFTVHSMQQSIDIIPVITIGLIPRQSDFLEVVNVTDVQRPSMSFTKRLFDDVFPTDNLTSNATYNRSLTTASNPVSDAAVKNIGLVPTPDATGATTDSDPVLSYTLNYSSPAVEATDLLLSPLFPIDSVTPTDNLTFTYTFVADGDSVAPDDAIAGVTTLLVVDGETVTTAEEVSNQTTKYVDENAEQNPVSVTDTEPTITIEP